MARHVALLRAVNVGGHVVKMVSLRELFVAMGFQNVETFIQTGNVVFEAAGQRPAALERAIEASLHEALGYPVTTFIRSIPQLDEVARRDPFGRAAARTGASTYVAFLKKPLTPACARQLGSLASGAEAVHFEHREVHWLRPDLKSTTLFAPGLLERTIGMQTTVRNMSTIRGMAAKYCTG